MKILLSTSDNIRADYYFRMLRALGAEPVGGYCPAYEKCDGLLLCGGADIDPSIYGKENRGSRGIDPARDRAELALLKAHGDKPVLGICRGIQMMNAYFGGTLVQDLPTADAHANQSRDLFHPVRTEEGSLMEKLYGPSFWVNSAHHQAVEQAAPGFTVTLRALDGTAEAIEAADRPCFGVQFHPERMLSPDIALGKKVFEAFLTICEKQ